MRSAHTGPTFNTEEDRAFLQRRVALFGLIAGGSSFFFFLYRTVFALVAGVPEEMQGPSYWLHLASSLALFASWLICRKGRYTVRTIRIIEFSSILGGYVAMGLAMLHVPLVARPDYILLLATTLALAARAIFVPSSGVLSFVLAILIGVDLVGVVYVAFRKIDLQAWSAVVPGSMELTQSEIARNLALNAAAWWAIVVLITTLTSVVIYGLRRQIRDAQQLGQYRLEQKLGEGGMGVVYRASHAFLRRPTAVKLLPPEKAGEDNVRRFEKEVQLTAQLTHPNTIKIFDYGHTPDGIFYYAMEYLEGLNLGDLVKRSGPLPQGRVVHLMRQATAALVEAHGIGLVHRDIKPANIMVQLLHQYGGVGDFVKVVDFGLVKEVRQEGGIELTNEADISGTPQYLSPEAITAPETLDARSDLYALGAVAYFLLTGTHVFSAKTIVEICGHHLHSKPEPPSARLQAPVSPDLEALILACLQKDRADRPRSALELEQRLFACTDVEPWSADDAIAWWKAYGQRPEREPASDEASILSIDLEHGRFEPAPAPPWVSYGG